MSTVKSMVVSTIGLRLGAHLHPMAVDSLQDGSTLVKTLEPKLSIVKLLKVSVFAPHLCRSNQDLGQPTSSRGCLLSAGHHGLCCSSVGEK